MRLRRIALCSTTVGMVVLLIGLLSTPAQSQLAPKKREFGLYAARPGTGSYGFSLVLATLVNKYSKSLTLRLRTASGSSEHLRIMTKEPAARRSNLFTVELVTMLWAREGIKFFKQPYTGGRAIGLYSNATLILATYDEKIKTPNDFVGKRIMAYPKFFSAGHFVEVLVKNVWKIGDRVTLSHGFPTAVTRALGDRTVDIGQVDVDGMPRGPWKQGEELSQLQVLKPGLHFIGFTEEDFKAASKIMKVDLPSDMVSPGSYGPNQKEPLRGVVSTLFWGADESMDPDVVYEVTRILYEHIDELNASYPSSLLTRKKMAAINVSENLFHPGAAKFYKEMGIKIGLK